MSFLDDMNVLIGGGMNAAARKTQSLRLQAELSKMFTAKEQALTSLGRAVYAGEEPDTKYAEQIRVIADLDAQIAALQQQYASLQSNANGMAQGPMCPRCGNPVSLDAPYCPRCGDNLAIIKSQYRKCPPCGLFYAADSMFCERCGGRTVELGVVAGRGVNTTSRPVQPSAPNSALANAGVNTDSSSVGAAQTGVCPHCGASVRQGAVHCGTCGNRL